MHRKIQTIDNINLKQKKNMEYNYTEFINNDNEEMINCLECGHECFLDENGNYECGVCGHNGYIGEYVNGYDVLYNIENEDSPELKAFRTA